MALNKADIQAMIEKAVEKERAIAEKARHKHKEEVSKRMGDVEQDLGKVKQIAKNEGVMAKLEAIENGIKDNKEEVKSKLNAKVFYALLTILVLVLGWMAVSIQATQVDIAQIKTKLEISANHQ